MKILVKKLKEVSIPKTIDKGEWIDLESAETYDLCCPYANTLSKQRTARNVVFNNCLISLGIAMKLPEGYEAVIVPRSSSFKHYGIIQTNSMGVIDNSYSSNKDEWKMPVICTRKSIITKGDRVCQFRIQLSQKATFWQKLKWLFSSKIELVETDDLGDNERGGFGSTGR